MKKIISMAFMAICLMLAACSGNEADSVAKKISDGKTIEQKDYTVMLDYCLDAFKEVDSTLKAGKLDEKTSEELEKKYKHLDPFMQKISTGYSSFDKTNQEKFKSLMNLALTIYNGALTAPNTPVDIDAEPDSISVTEEEAVVIDTAVS